MVTAILAGVNALDASPIGVFYDDAHYVILGKAIALGEGYRYINLPGAPAATHFPPGYPALLALLWRISPVFPENLALFKMANAVLLGALALGAYVAARRWLDLRPVTAGAAVLACTVAIPPLLLASNVISETLLLALLLPLLLLADDSSARPSVRRAIAVGILTGAACLVRAHAIVLFPAIAVAFWSRRRIREAAAVIITGLLVLLPWLIWVRQQDPRVPPQFHGQYGSYVAWFARGLQAEGPLLLLVSLRDNIVTSWAIIARSFSLARNPVLDTLAVVSVITLLVAGAFALAHRARVMLAFLALYLGLILVWPFSPLRFIWGVWPLLVLTMIGGALYLWSAPFRPRLARTVCIAASAVTIAGALFFTVQGYRNAWWATVSRSYAPRIQPQLVWVTANTQPSDVVVTDDEGAVYLYTGRQALPVSPFTAEQYIRQRPLEQNADWLAETLRVFSPAYVIAWAKPTIDAAEMLVARRPPALVQADTIPTGRVYRRATATTPSEPSPPR